MPSGCVSGRHARPKSASVPGLIWRVVIQTQCSSTVASSRTAVATSPRRRRRRQPCQEIIFQATATLTAHNSRPGPAVPARPATAATAARQCSSRHIEDVHLKRGDV
jgi:hypothetical protein